MRQRLCHALHLTVGVWVLLGPWVITSLAQEAQHLTIRTSAGEMFDDNVTFAKHNTRDDFITILGVGGGWTKETKLRSFDINANLTQRFFARNPDFNTMAEDAHLLWKGELSKYSTFSLANDFTHDVEPRSLEDEFGRTAGRYGYVLNRFNAEYDKTFTKRFGLATRYANDIHVLSRSDLTDSHAHRAGADVTYAVSSATTLLGGYEFSIRDFVPGPSSFTNSALAGFQQYFTPTLYLDGRAGVDVIDTFDGDVLPRPRVRVSLNREPDARTRGALVFERAYTTTTFNQSLFKEWKTSLNYYRQLLRRLSGGLSAFYGQGEYLSTSVKDTFGGVNFGLTYDITKLITGRAAYRVSALDSSEPDRGYVKNTVVLGVTMVF
ncbi:MAG: outer membrane beta-barrel protein [Candidatus Omnitrophica bacterium]|nr:outer membrane beta-barrel protein [Candidatus Omnitrophota bacterium]